uniref:GAF domain-containing protein n=1 Tax=Palpitomonas bilix TaxID=652834 RepID=A0A7S3DBW9_9EUKA|mmetsp:Transcript_30172/g.77942  ORF Transcript_30172/g.77942 Transcript_30172/m.77942 type:complete len:678 (+) Transcript_30172:461-2494(+)|eukprot:CAMPEP_0113909028 /NCGR_PEP_ID=MMETSP0780_2-20120614/26561_1 /TAXON_ID=652834 /ORGANISM="Palpitomonas bilix" /LENGTH=677 /DNA_ID=CAMNT_0000904665 /DNA_START=756 /DNA_END=2789 /DNA_ORIENTATION=+ /assembly_acc=CAM_ASM_000599
MDSPAPRSTSPHLITSRGSIREARRNSLKRSGSTPSPSPHSVDPSTLEEVMLSNQMKDWGKKILDNTELDTLFDTVMDELRTVVHAERSTLFVADRSKQQLWSKVANGTVEIRLRFGDGLAGSCAATGDIVNVEDAYFDKRFNSAFDKKNNFRTKAVLCVPILDPKMSKVVGVAQVINKKDVPAERAYFSKSDEKLMKALCEHIGRAIEQCMAAEAGGKLFMAMAAAQAFSNKAGGQKSVLLKGKESIKSRMMRVASHLHKLATFNPASADVLNPILDLTSMFQGCSSVVESNMIATQLLQPDILRALRRAARSGGLHSYLALRLLNFISFHPSAREALSNLELIPVLIGVLASSERVSHLPASLLLESLAQSRNGLTKVARFGGTHVLVRLLENGEDYLRPACLRLLSALLTTERGREDIVDGQVGRNTLGMILHGLRGLVLDDEEEGRGIEPTGVAGKGKGRRGEQEDGSEMEEDSSWLPRSASQHPAGARVVASGRTMPSPPSTPQRGGSAGMRKHQVGVAAEEKKGPHTPHPPPLKHNVSFKTKADIIKQESEKGGSDNGGKEDMVERAGRVGSDGATTSSSTLKEERGSMLKKSRTIWKKGIIKAQLISKFNAEESALARRITREINMWEKTIKTQLQATGGYRQENTIQNHFQRVGLKFQPSALPFTSIYS